MDFYNYIVKLTKEANQDNVYVRDSDIIFKLIMKEFDLNIQNAAFKGFSKAYILIYEINARYQNIIPIDVYIRMTDEMTEKFNKIKLKSVLDRIKETIYPFELELIVLNNYIALLVKWNIK